MNLFYCLDCMRIFENDFKCEYCNSENISFLRQDSPVNIIGSKIKGRLLRYKDNKATLIIPTENNDKILKEYYPNKLRKIL